MFSPKKSHGTMWEVHKKLSKIERRDKRDIVPAFFLKTFEAFILISLLFYLVMSSEGIKLNQIEIFDWAFCTAVIMFMGCFGGVYKFEFMVERLMTILVIAVFSLLYVSLKNIGF